MKFVVFGVVVIVLAGGAIYFMYRQGVFQDIADFGEGFDLRPVGGGSGEEEEGPSGGGTPEAPRPPVGGPPRVDPEDIPFGFVASDLSVYFDKVHVTSITRSSQPGAPTLVTISSRFDGPEYPLGIDVTNWRVQSNRDVFFVPRAAALFWGGPSSAQNNVLLSARGRVIVSSNPSPVGTSFRLNACTGYLEEGYDFDPPLLRQCPRPERHEISSFTGACQSYILGLGTCVHPDLNNPAVISDFQCANFMRDTFQYAGCFRQNAADPDFLKDEWRLFLGRPGAHIADPEHDRILLFDLQGKLVSEYLY